MSSICKGNINVANDTGNIFINTVKETFDRFTKINNRLQTQPYFKEDCKSAQWGFR